MRDYTLQANGTLVDDMHRPITPPTERELFEAKIKRDWFGNPFKRHPVHKNRYYWGHIQLLWQGWCLAKGVDHDSK